MPTTVTKPPILDDTGQDILTQLRRIADAKESNLMGYGGAVLFSNLPNPTTTNLNLFYLIQDAFTTDSRFVVGAGISEPAGKYWAVINIGTDAAPVCKYDELGTLIDLSSKQDKNLSSSIVVDGVTRTTVEGALGAINSLAANNKTHIGTLSSLSTTVKTDLVSAINEVNTSAGNTALAGLTTDVSISTPADDQVLVFDGSAGVNKWKNQSVLDKWIGEQTLSAGDDHATFTIDDSKAYDVYFECATGYAPPTLTKFYQTASTTARAEFSAVTSDQAGTSGNACKIVLKEMNR